jgi:hypothetical protein
MILEQNCTITIGGKAFTAGGAWLTDQGGAVYIVENSGRLEARTWHGEKLADAELVSRWNMYGASLGRYEMRAIRFAWEGKVYHGRYSSDWSELCKVRRMK